MIFVILGTQDKTFERLLKAIDREIKNGNIKEKVIVQAGQTKYESKNMEILSFISMEEFNNYIKEADIIITHGGVGTIVESLKQNKKVLAAARLCKYGEHENDHQKQIVSNFKKNGYILELDDFDKLDEKLIELKSFVPKKYTGNNKKMLKLVEDEINSYKHNYLNLLITISIIILIIFLIIIMFI